MVPGGGVVIDVSVLLLLLWSLLLLSIPIHSVLGKRTGYPYVFCYSHARRLPDASSFQNLTNVVLLEGAIFHETHSRCALQKLQT